MGFDITREQSYKLILVILNVISNLLMILNGTKLKRHHILGWSQYTVISLIKTLSLKNIIIYT